VTDLQKSHCMQKTNILVVDDEKDICRALNIILSKEGYAVTEAYNENRPLSSSASKAMTLS